MSNSEETEELHNEDVANTYEHLTKVVNAKNEIKRCIILNTEEHNVNEMKEGELEDILHDVRIKIISNPILKELNTISDENAVDQRKLAEGIYSELPDLSSRSDMYEEKFSKFSGEYNLVEKLHSTVVRKFEEKLNKMSSLRIEWENKAKVLMRTKEEDILGQCEELRYEIKKLTEDIIREKNSSECLIFQKDSQLILLKKITEMFEQNSATLIELGNVGMKSNEITSLEAKQAMLSSEITELSDKSSILVAEINELKQQITIYQVSKTKLLEQLDKEKSFSKKKAYSTSINELKFKLSIRQKLACLEENIFKEKNILLKKQTESELCKSQSTEISNDIQIHIETTEKLVREKAEMYENNMALEKKMKHFNEKLSNISEEKTELEFSNNVNNEKHKIILQEVNKMKENISSTELVIEQLNNQISSIQTEISVEEKVAETPSFGELEKENEILDTKIRRYIRAIEICKQSRAAAMKKKRNYNEFSDTSDDSMLLPNRRK